MAYSPKIPRNAPCPCRSGRKFKHCHGRIGAHSTDARAPSEDDIRQFLASAQAENQQREQQQGQGRPIVSTEHKNYRMVVVGNRVFYSPKWKTFHDFLREYPQLLFGRPWLEKQAKKPVEERHPYLQWMQRALDDHKRLAVKQGPITTGPMTAAISSVMGLAYNLYLIHHNLPATPESKKLCDRLVKRLKNPDLFWGTLYETYAFSLFAVAGFLMELEDETDGKTSHCEFKAKGKSGRIYSVECKARIRTQPAINADGSLKIDAETLGLSKKLKDALAKATEHERVVFLDIDMPGITNAAELQAVADFCIPHLRELEDTLLVDGQAAPPAYVFVTNNPDHRVTGEQSFGLQAFATGFKISNFGHGVVHRGMHALMQSRQDHSDVLSLQEAAKVRHAIPSTFDGSNPALAFSGDVIPRLKIGNWYKVPTATGEEVDAQLCEGTVLESTETAHCIYRTKDNQYLHCTNTLTNDEMDAYRLHPQTFFGVVKPSQGRKAETVIELFDFFFESYQHTPKEKLLEFLTGAADYDELKDQSQRDLAITYCERVAVSAFSQHSRKADKS